MANVCSQYLFASRFDHRCFGAKGRASYRWLRSLGSCGEEALLVNNEGFAEELDVDDDGGSVCPERWVRS